MHPAAHSCAIVSGPLLARIQGFRRALIEHGMSRAVTTAFVDEHLHAARDFDEWQIHRQEDAEGTSPTYGGPKGLREHPSRAEFDGLRDAICAHVLAENPSVVSRIVGVDNDYFVFTLELDATTGAVHMHLDEQVTVNEERFRYAGPMGDLPYLTPSARDTAATLQRVDGVRHIVVAGA